MININDITIDSKSGFSGAGKKFEKNLSIRIYTILLLLIALLSIGISVKLIKKLLNLQKKKIKYSFNPHLLPTFRGILTSIYLKKKLNVSLNKIRNELIKFYKKSKFIKILKLNSEIGSGNVLKTNNCEISICETRIKDKIIIFSAIDNLVKGAAGQAVQNMNLQFRLNESLGLK